MSKRIDLELPAKPLRPKVGVVGLSSPLEVGAQQAPIASCGGAGACHGGH